MEEKIEKPKHFWFRAKRYGWGWYPSAWQGWAVLLLYILLVLYIALRFDNGIELSLTGVAYFIVRVFAITSLLIWVCYKTGERPRWSWGSSSRLPPDDGTNP